MDNSTEAHSGDLQSRIDLELVRRSRPGNLVAFPTALLGLVGTGMFRLDPWISIPLLILSLLSAGGRNFVAKIAPGRYHHNPIQTMRIFRAGILLTPIVWGTVCIVSLATWGLGPESIIAVLVAGGYSCGANTGFNADRMLHDTYIALIWIPITLGTLMITPRNYNNYSLAVMFVLFGGFLIQQGRVQAERFYETLSLNVQLEESDRIKDEFLALATHDLRNGIQSVMMAGGVLQKCEEPLALKMAANVKQNARYLATLTSDLHDMARLGLQAVQLQLKEVDLSALLTRVAEQVPNPESLDIQLKGLDDSLVLNADEIRLQQVFTNLVSNAIKYNQIGGSVKVSAESAGSHFIVDVEDTGVGIPQQELDQIFDLHFRSEANRHRRGSGLGLCISRQLIQLHGGSIEVKSELGDGSCFRVILPRLAR